MAAKFQIYLRDELVNRSNYTAQRKVQEIQDILRNIDPSSTLPQKINPTNQGFIVTYTNDSDVNFIFNPTNISLLKNQKLTSELARETQNLRQVVISGLTDEIYSKPDTDIVQEIDQNNHSKVLLLSRFDSRRYNKKYLFVTLDSKVARDQIIDKGNIDLFQSNLSVHPLRPKQRSVNSFTHYPPQTYITRSAQGQGQALSSASYWGKENSHQNHPQGPKSNHPGRNHPYQNHPADFRVASETNDIDFKVIIEATSKVCEVLSYGVENPKAYISLVNQSLAHRYRGFSHIFIPPSAIKDSQELYLIKLSVNPSPEPQTQSQTSSTQSAATTTTSLSSTTSTPPAPTITTTTNTSPISSTIPTAPADTIPSTTIPPTSSTNTQSTATSLVTQSITESSPSDSNHIQNPIISNRTQSSTQNPQEQSSSPSPLSSHNISVSTPSVLTLPHTQPNIPTTLSPSSHQNPQPSSTTTISASCLSTPISHKTQVPSSPAQCNLPTNAVLVADSSYALVGSPKLTNPGRAVYVTNPLLHLYPNSYTPTIQALDSYSANNYIH